MMPKSAEFPLAATITKQIRATDPNNQEANQQILTDALSSLFEPSPTLKNEIVPALIQRIQTTHGSDESQLPQTYPQLIDLAIQLVRELPDTQKAEFIDAHPRIGEVKGLSVFSAAEQGQSSHSKGIVPTPPEVLKRLEYLNTVYEKRYPGLVYITFVNGRTRAQIRDELEAMLTEEGVLPAADEPYGLETIQPHFPDSESWRSELDRAIGDVRNIALDRLRKLGM